MLPVIVLLVVVLWDCNGFRPMLEARPSAALQRKLTIANLDVQLRWHPWIDLDDVVLANPPDMPDGTLASIGQLSIQLDPWAWFTGDRPVLPALIIDRLRGRSEAGTLGPRQLGVRPAGV